MCARFIMLCRRLDLFAEVSVVIDGSKFKAVNNRDKNFTRAKMERRLGQIEESVARYLHQLDSADRQEPSEARETKTTRLKEKMAKLKEEMQRLRGLKGRMLAAPDQQISLTDPDSRSMATSGRGSGVVGYNVQVAVDTKHHLIITHEVTNVRSDRAQLAHMAKETKAALERTNLDVIADRGYFSSEEILECDEAGITVTLPKPMISNSKHFGKQDFRYVAEQDVYICPAGEKLAYSFTTEEHGLILRRYLTNVCQSCAAAKRLRSPAVTFTTIPLRIPQNSHDCKSQGVLQRDSIVSFDPLGHVNVSERELTSLISSAAEAEGSSFSKIFSAQDERGTTLRKAIQVARDTGWVKASQWQGQLMPLLPTATTVPISETNNPVRALDQLNAMAEKMRAASPEMTPAKAFERTYMDPANAALVARERAEARARLPTVGDQVMG